MNFSKILILFFIFPSISSLFAQDIQCYFEINRYNTPSETPYVEVLISVDASALTFKEEEGRKNAGIEFTVLFLQNEKVRTYDKFDLISPELEPEDPENFNLMAMRRIVLPNGHYDVEIKVKDLYNPDHFTVYPPDTLTMAFEPGAVDFSDIRLLDSISENGAEHIFAKNGLILYPHFVNYYPKEAENISFYTEIYNLDEHYLNEDVLVTYGIYPLTNDQALNGLFSFTKIKGAAVNPILGSLSISDVPRGFYRLKVELRDRENHLITSKDIPFFRNGEESGDPLLQAREMHLDSTFADAISASDLAWYLDAVKPIAGNIERNAIEAILAKSDTQLMRQFFYNFWISRSMDQPEKAWKTYRQRLLFVQNEFSVLNRRSYQTDRGRIYLQYGEPDERFESKYETDASPYEIWRYNRTPFGETNVIFVFKATDLVSNDFELIHSNATGERKNENWELVVRNAFNVAPGFDKEERPGTFGNSNDELFKDQ